MVPRNRVFALAVLAAFLVAACDADAPSMPPQGGAAGSDPQIHQTATAQAQSPNWPDTKARVRAAFPDVPQLSVTDLEKELEGQAPPLLIDVRAPEEYAVSHLPGAVNAQGRALTQRVRDAGEKRPIVLYCSVGYRSSREAEALRGRGFKNVRNLEGSIFAWANAGNPLVRGGPASQTPTRAVHPFDEEWGVLLDAERRSYSPR